MCQNPNTPSVNLQTAVLMQVQEFVNSGQAFSRYDITKALRQKCNDGLLDIPEIEDTNPGVTNRYNVSKDAVDTIFEQLYQNCLANGLPPLSYSYNRQGGYRVFAADPNAVQAVSQPATYVSQPNVPTLYPGVATSTPTITPITPTTTVTLSDPEIRRRVGLYMDHCGKIGLAPTLKQIQSAIKRGSKSTGLSYREIANVATSLGYKV
jgi:hypothetical protein